MHNKHNLNLFGKKALITGASSGIGAETASFFAMNGIHVILTARRIEKLNQLQKEITNSGGKASVFQCDLTIEEERISLIHSLNQSNLMPDILINNAGIAWYGYIYSMPINIALEIIRVNVEAVTHLALLTLPFMLENGYGRIVNIGSIAGKLPEQGIGVYSATKAYLDALTKSMNRDLRGTGVSVSVIRAGPVKTEFFETARNLKNGSSIPAEKNGISAIRVARLIFNIVQHPRSYAYIPGLMVFSPLLEVFFSGIIDFVGPILLRRKNKKQI